MQSFHKGAATPDFLYDGLPPAAQEFLRNPIPKIQSVTTNVSRGPWSLQRLRQSLSRTKIILLVFWIWLLSWGEKSSFESHVSKCRWENWEKWETSANPHHLVLLADPQLVDPHTYPGRPWPLSTLTIKHTDQYLRRSFQALDNQLDPQSVFFLGDLFDGGREWTTGTSKSPESRWHKYDTAYWLWEYDRFGKIYHEQWRKSSLTSAHHDRMFISTIPGNHDLGLGHGIQIPVRDRFQTYFGNGNRVDSVANHTFVSIDSVSLSARLQFEGSEGYKPNPDLWKPTEDFLANVQQHKHRVSSRARHVQLGTPENALQNQTTFDQSHIPKDNQWTVSADAKLSETPTILLTHVPLWREPDTPCGPLRERHPPAAGKDYDPDAKDPANAIAVAFGYQYQNVLAKELSSEVVKSVGNIKYVFSGDDHDYCAVVHKDLDPNQPAIPEITVKSTSWAMGVRKPGFLLVSLWNPLDGATAPKQTIQTYSCLLPDQLGIFIRYIQLIVITMLVLAVRSFIIRRSILKNTGKEYSLLPPPATTPTHPVSPSGRDRTDSDSYSSSSSNGKTGLAARSNASRGQLLSPGLEMDQGTYMNPSRPHSPAYLNTNDSKWKNSSVSTRRVQVSFWAQPTVRDFYISVLHVATGALLWYWWLARTV